MSTFEVLARRITVSPHENADALEVAHVDGYRSVVRLGEFADGDMAIYIPEQALLPEGIVAALGLTGRLAGPEANRVKAVRLRGVLSQGLLYRPAGVELREGEDYAERFGITKWVPPVPTNMAGEAEPCTQLEPYTEIENIKRYPDVFASGEIVVATEKAHGTCTICTYDAERDRVYVTSKGMAKKGLGLIDTRDEHGRPTNAYWRVVHDNGLPAKLGAFAAAANATTVTVYGETLGVQDLMYGLARGDLALRVFDVRVDGRFLDPDRVAAATAEMDLERVPELYRGPFSDEAIWKAATGKEAITGRATHIREGVVVRPVVERDHPALGRVIVKAVSDAYLTRKGDATEYE